MVLTAERHSNVAAAYEKLAANESTPPEQRAAFARKANWHCILARITAETEGRALGWPLTRPSKETPDGQRAGPLTELQSEALLFSPRRLAAARFAAEAFKGKRQPAHAQRQRRSPSWVRSLLERLHY